MTTTNEQGCAGSEIPSASEKRAYRHCASDQFRVRLDISYDGADFFGWQRQTNHPSVQGTLEAAVAQIFGEPITVLGASRTDTGVHAVQQVAHFDIKKDPRTFKDLTYSIQCLLPDSIAIKKAYLAPADFHSIATSTGKTYRYTILNRQRPSAQRRGATWWVRQPLNLTNLNSAAHLLIGTHDFKSFQTTGTTVESTIRRVQTASWELVDRSRFSSESGPDSLEFTIAGEGFLKQMVRNLVGTMVDLELDHRAPQEIAKILQAVDRRKAGNTAPAQGLYLARVHYPHELDKRCLPL